MTSSSAPSTLRIAGIIEAEPDSGGDLLTLSPTLLVNRADVEGTGLPGQPYQLPADVRRSEPIAALRQWLLPQVKGLRLLSVDDTQRGVRQAFDLAGRFLGLSALLAVLLAGVATALAANRFALRRIDQVAILPGRTPARHPAGPGAAAADAGGASLCARHRLGMAAQEGLVQVRRLAAAALPHAALPASACHLLRLRGAADAGAQPFLRLRCWPVAALAPAAAVQVTGDLKLALWVLGGLAWLAAGAVGFVCSCCAPAAPPAWQLAVGR